MDKVSVIIPDRNGQPYLQQTIDDLLLKSDGVIEIIVACDGVWPNPPLKNDPRVIILHHGTVHDNLYYTSNFIPEKFMENTSNHLLSPT